MDIFGADQYLWVAGFAAVLIGLSKGGLPVVGMLAVPLLSVIMSPVKAAALLLPIYVVSDAFGVWIYRREFNRPNLVILIPAGIVGVLVGWLTVAFVSETAIAFLIGIIGVVFCLDLWLRRRAAGDVRGPQRFKGWFWGTLTGFTSFIAHAGAPPYQVYMLPQRLPRMVYAGTTTLLFAVLNLVKLVPYHQLRPYTGDGLWSAALLIPFSLVGVAGGVWLTRRLGDVWFYRAMQIALFLVSIYLVVRAVRQFFGT